jgi:hypothetical protein
MQMLRLNLKVKSRKTDDNLRRFSPESRKCYFEDEKPLKFFKTYTKLNCELECKARKILELCGCVSYDMPRDNLTKVCNFIEAKCSKISIDCDCYTPCNDVIFELTSQKANFNDKTEKKFTFWAANFYNEQLVEETEHYLAYKVQNCELNAL